MKRLTDEPTPTGFQKSLLRAYAMLARTQAGKEREPVISMHFDDWVLSGEPEHVECKRGAVMIACSCEIEHGQIEIYYSEIKKGA